MPSSSALYSTCRWISLNAHCWNFEAFEMRVQIYEVLFTLFQRTEAVIIEIATVEHANWRVKVYEDLDIALEMVELSWVACFA